MSEPGNLQELVDVLRHDLAAAREENASLRAEGNRVLHAWEAFRTVVGERDEARATLNTLLERDSLYPPLVRAAKAEAQVAALTAEVERLRPAKTFEEMYKRAEQSPDYWKERHALAEAALQSAQEALRAVNEWLGRAWTSIEPISALDHRILAELVAAALAQENGWLRKDLQDPKFGEVYEKELAAFSPEPTPEPPIFSGTATAGEFVRTHGIYPGGWPDAWIRDLASEFRRVAKAALSPVEAAPYLCPSCRLHMIRAEARHHHCAAPLAGESESAWQGKERVYHHIDYPERESPKVEANLCQCHHRPVGECANEDGS